MTVVTCSTCEYLIGRESRLRAQSIETRTKALDLEKKEGKTNLSHDLLIEAELIEGEANGYGAAWALHDRLFHPEGGQL